MPTPLPVPPPLPPSLLELLNVSRRYGSGPPASEDASLSVRAGEAVAVLGPSGSGKSTLLNLIAGLDRPDSGSVTVDRARVDRLGEAGAARYRRAKIGMVFQFFHLLDDLSVADNVALPARLAGLGRRESHNRGGRAAGVTRHRPARRRPSEPAVRRRTPTGSRSKGVDEPPPLLLADEPTGALDSASGEEVSRLLRDAELKPLGVTASTDRSSNGSDSVLDSLTALLTLMLVCVAGLGVLGGVVLDTHERVHDLGIHKALGMTPRQTVTMVVSSVVPPGLAAAPSVCHWAWPCTAR